VTLPDRPDPREQPGRAGWLVHSFRRVFSFGGARIALSVQVADLSAVIDAREEALARRRPDLLLPGEAPAEPAEPPRLPE
jgi:hypothetical protein